MSEGWRCLRRFTWLLCQTISWLFSFILQRIISWLSHWFIHLNCFSCLFPFNPWELLPLREFSVIPLHHVSCSTHSQFLFLIPFPLDQEGNLQSLNSKKVSGIDIQSRPHFSIRSLYWPLFRLLLPVYYQDTVHERNFSSQQHKTISRLLPSRSSGVSQLNFDRVQLSLVYMSSCPSSDVQRLPEEMQ